MFTPHNCKFTDNLTHKCMTWMRKNVCWDDITFWFADCLNAISSKETHIKKKKKKKTSMALFLMYKTNILLYNVIIKLTVRTLYILMAIHGPACGKRFLFVVKKGDSFLLHSAIYHTDHHSRAGYYFLNMKICNQTREKSCSYRVILCFIAAPLIKICNH